MSIRQNGLQNILQAVLIYAGDQRRSLAGLGGKGGL